MGRSLVPAAALADKQPYDKAHNNDFTAFDILFHVDRQGDRVYHRQTRLDAAGKPIYDFAHEVSYVIGSGTRGHSYLTVRDGFVFQTPISWYSQKQMWDLSPGFPPSARAGRLVQGACLFCHVNRVEPVENTRNRYQQPVFRGLAIGCERCHGPGERHAKTLDKDDIVNPKRLEPALREAVCQQCHLQGATRVLRRGRGLNDYRPGMPLQEFLTVFIRGPGLAEKKAVGHVEQMYQSLCFRRTAGNQMGCTTCHDPHQAVAPEQRVDYYRSRCLKCHAEHGCSLPEESRRQKEPADSCVACHMPPSTTSDIVHTAATDHRIVRMAGVEPTDRGGNGPAPNLPLLDFYRGAPDLEDKELARDLGVGLYQLTLSGVRLTGDDGEFACGLLSEALRDCPGDLDAWEAKGKLLQALGRPAAASDAFEALLERAPAHEGALVTLGAIHRDQGHADAALESWRRAVAVNPWVAEYRKNLVFLLADANAWDEVGPQCQKWLELDPASAEARQVWVQFLIKSGRKAEAEAEFAKLRALRPTTGPELDAWFARQMR
jgi:Tfp pilus assembly protein PilF